MKMEMKIMRISALMGVSLLLLGAPGYSRAGNYRIASPDGNLVMEIGLAGSSRTLTYRIDYENKPVVVESKFGITCDDRAWDHALTVVSTNSRQCDATWNPLYGERSTVRDHFNEMTLYLAREGGATNFLRLIARVYNTGAAFRYAFSETEKIYGMHPFRINGESTEFRFPEQTRAWFTEKAQTVHQLLPLTNWPGESDRPLTLELPNGLFVCLTEAEMTNYARTKFKLAADKSTTIVGSMYEGVDELPPLNTPWRVVMVAKTAGELLQNNDLIMNLNPPCALTNTAWIKPGKVMREMTLSTEGSKKLVDFAVIHNIQYIDLTFWNGDDITYNATQAAVPAWRSTKPYDLQEIVRYAKSKGVGVWLYVNQRPLAAQLDTLLPLYRSWGIAGIKFGFVHVGSHRWTTWLHEAVRKCAQYELMVDIHDEYRPTGYSRTYPNLLTQEGVRGNEEMPDAVNNTVLPFTRYIAGAADYTMCYYARKEFGRTGKHIQNTPAHQLALPVIYYSPLQYMFWYDTPDKYEGEPEIEFWDALPTVWDDTKVLAGEIGKYVSVARRSGQNWFLGTITNTDARELKLRLSFLDKHRDYEAVIYSDDPTVNTRTHVGIQKIKVNDTTELIVKLPASGGQAALLRPI
jgi:alpha-glucosidase